MKQQIEKMTILVSLEKFLTRVQTLCVALRAARNSPVLHGNSVINYAIAVRLFRTVLRD